MCPSVIIFSVCFFTPSKSDVFFLKWFLEKNLWKSKNNNIAFVMSKTLITAKLLL